MSIALRAGVVASALAAWFFTQSLLARRRVPASGIGDALHALTAPLNRWLHAHPRGADTVLIASSAYIDALALTLIGVALLGPSFRPFVGLVLLFGLRQACQGLCALPPPEGMLWRRPRVPALLVTYGTATDLFFSGHTAMAVYGAIELGRLGGAEVAGVAAGLAVLEAATVLVLRAHYTMDVIAGAAAAFCAACAADRLAPFCDDLLVAAALAV